EQLTRRRGRRRRQESPERAGVGHESVDQGDGGGERLVALSGSGVRQRGRLEQREWTRHAGSGERLEGWRRKSGRAPTVKPAHNVLHDAQARIELTPEQRQRVARREKKQHAEVDR